MRVFISFLFLFFLSGCGSLWHHTGNFFLYEDSLMMTEYDLFKLLKPRKEDKIEIRKNYYSDSLFIENEIYMPEEPSIIQNKKISINISEEVPILAVIMAIANEANLNIQVDPTISGGVILNLKDTDVKYVFNRICGATETRYREKDGIIIFSQDTPYSQTYSVDFLDMSRNGTASMALNTSVISSTGSGSSASVSSSSTDKFWDDISSAIEELIKSTESNYRYRSKVTSNIQKVQSDKVNSTEIKDLTQLDNENKSEDVQTKSVNDNKLTEDFDKVIESGKMNINKRAGLITVTATEKAHREIKSYLSKLSEKMSAQVLIEMKFLEISLNKKFQSGVDLRTLASLASGIGATVSSPFGAATGATSMASISGLGNSFGLSSIVNLLETVGSVKTLQNPRITALNNQPSLLTIATNQVYFKTSVTLQTATSTASGALPATKNVQAEAKTIPVGIVLSVTPSIDLDKRKVTLNMKPTISKVQITGQEDPSIQAFNQENQARIVEAGGNVSDLSKVKSEIPITQIRELDSIIKLEDGDIALLGGFTERVKQVTENGIPILRSIPLIGILFGDKTVEEKVLETLILIRVEIIDEKSNRMNYFDSQIYNALSEDPRNYIYNEKK